MVTEQTRNDLLIATHKLMDKALFSDKLKATNEKKDLEKFVNYIDKYEALHKNFIWYGNHRATQFCIIDIDNENTPFKQYIETVKYTLGLEPTWILKSSKGYHVGFILDTPVFANDKSQVDKLTSLKKTLSLLLNADTSGSLRHYGYWRNPLNHKSYLNPVTFNINKLEKKINHRFHSSFSLFDEPKINEQKLEQKKNGLSWLNVEKEGFKEGNRNNYLFRTGVRLLYQGLITNEYLLDTLLQINNNTLPLKEVQSIAKSILKYNITPNTVNQVKIERPKRGEYSNELFNNKIHNYRDGNKVELERQRIGQVISSAKKIIKSVQTIQEAYKKLYSEGKTITNKKLSLLSGRSKRTVQYYKKIDKGISTRAFMDFVREVGANKGEEKDTMFRANCTPLINDLNKALEHLVFTTKRYNKSYRFAVDDDLKLIFFEVSDNIYGLCA